MKLTTLIPLCLAALLGVAAGASAQGGGFNSGELFLYTNGIQSPGYNGGGIMRVDPVTGSSSVFAQTSGVYDFVGAMTFDPYRQRLLFTAGFSGPQKHLWAADGAGNLANLSLAVAPNGLYWNNLAPTGDGRIYCHIDGDGTAPIRWFDAANQLHVLYDTDGVTFFKIDGDAGYALDGMIHDAATNALFVASTKAAPGFPTGRTNVRRLQLSADGSRVIGPVGNVQFDVSSGSTQEENSEVPRGWSHGPDGQLVLIVLCIQTQVLPRMLLVDPVTSAITPWGSNGYAGGPAGPAWATTTSGAYCSALNQVVVVDTSFGKLRGYGQGSTGGNGNLITTSPAAIAPGAFYYLNLISVPQDGCAGGWGAYGVGLKGAGNLVPTLTGAGCPEPGEAITLKLANALGGASAALFISLSKAALPFKGGTLHLGSVLLTVNLPMGGTPGLAGAGSLSLPTSLPAIPALSGSSLYLQAAFSDAAAVQGISLTQGLELAIG